MDLIAFILKYHQNALDTMSYRKRPSPRFLKYLAWKKISSVEREEKTNLLLLIQAH